MQCPECGHSPAAGDQVDPTRCPECGIYYHKALAAQVRKLEAEGARKDQDLAEAQERARATASAKSTVAPSVRNAAIDYRGAQPVVVLDVNMSFGTMVMFMVKLAFATIPAMIIIFGVLLAIGAAFGLLGGLLGAVGHLAS
ncbi:hypothetical protein N5J43_16970 [Pseudomonas nicosulfuronedens]|uniref:hypothetical protein n=1 Tax=Pseudomonas nicosulfuronedens TaxID=2571105 RepID=UPI0024480655|nr:hypothetical protein [Pseudomonas nicosulfuronedens]MDH1011987.1 hypothetical protein [Pseudomonas nicosulfuronedens]MDH1980645.1 hypothetical protein [Pseudomonas nicosulfuronedens]MDH2027595.1 hypothetical protein [Pseudomonas nicosulfuronedens]